MERPTCRTCPYWDIENASKTTGRGESEGLCRVSAPRPILILEIDVDDQAYVCWPKTLDVEFCSSHPGFPVYLVSLRPPNGETK